MKEIEKIAQQLESKLQKVESAREGLATKIRTKKQQIAQLEAALNHLRSFQKAVR